MKQIQLLYLLLLILGYSCTKSNETLSLNGTDWQFAEIVSPVSNTLLEWKAATVPGTVQTDLLKLGEIPHPFVLHNEDSIQWISGKNWAYKKEFSVPSETLKKKQHVLKFEGIDTYAEVKLNGETLLLTNNAFRTYEANVSWLLTEENTLEISFSNPGTIEKTASHKLNYQLPEAPRVFTRKPQFQYGWDWGPTIKTVGIWRDVSLVSFDEIRITNAYLKTENISEEKATLTAIIDHEAVETENYKVEIVNKTSGNTFEFPLLAKAGKSQSIIPLEIENPKRWWTHNLGEPFLYDFNITLKKNDVVIDSISKKVGLRDIELVTKKDSIGESFYFKLNGKPVYMKGANYIPQNIFLPEIKKEDRRKLIEDAVEANMNMLRVWGGGVYEDDLFYDLCDEKGILIWQDFMFACAMYPGDKTFLETVKAEAVDNVKRLRQHPSIALWCGNNENSEGWHRWGWQADKTEAQKEEIWRNYQKVFNDILPNVIDSLNPSISYWESSPKYGRGDKRYQFEGDAHDWWVWHDGYPFEHFEEEVPRFMSEFGFQSFPSEETIHYFTQLDSIRLDHPGFATHQKHSRGFQLIREYMARDFVVPENDSDYVYVSQLLQAYGITKGILAHRRAKPHNMGTLYWQLNDCWPAVSWSGIDALGNWKALHYDAKKAFENRKIIAWEGDEQLKITIVDDTFEPVQDSLLVRIKDFEGNIIKSQVVYNVKTNSRRNEVFLELPLNDFEFEPTSSFAEITFGNISAVHYFVKPKYLALTTEALRVTQTENTQGIAIKISAKTLQKDLFLSADVTGHFSDNFFDVLPSEEIEVQFFPKDKMPPEIRINSLNRINNKINEDIPTYCRFSKE